MKFFSGFSLRDEAVFFEDILDKGAYSVCGFSYGAIKALNFTLETLLAGKRVDRLQLISPAFFQTKSEKFKRLQMMGFRHSKEQYLAQFFSACFAPYEQKALKHAEARAEDLEELLYYRWDDTDLLKLLEKNVIVEVYLGGRDTIIDVRSAREFFTPLSDVTYVKNGNHFLLSS